MRYVSTRGEASPKDFSSIALAGLAEDGGLYLPETYPKLELDSLWRMRELTYAELAFEVIARFADDIDRQVLQGLCRRTYTPEVYCNARAGSDPCDIVPVRSLTNGLFLAELSNGPTLAFKDMALQFLGSLFEFLLTQRGQCLNILGATSGDTGSAAEYAMRSRQAISVFMLSPHGRMSDFQRAQMYSLADANIHNIAVRGVFDDCQDIVKAIGRDLDFKRRYSIGTVNSINWARIAAQVVYYVRGWLALARRPDEVVDVTVPTGNFGNILAAWIAKQMGVPFGRLVVATNENDVLDEFFKTGIYRVRDSAHTFSTSSPSMDISKASNFERYVFDVLGRNALRVRSLWEELESTGRFVLVGEDFEAVRATGMVSGRSTHESRLATIRDIERTEGILIDPHTADGVHVALNCRREGVRMLVMETAQAAKFNATILQAVGHAPEVPASYAGIEEKPERFTVLDANAQQVRDFLEEHLGTAH